MVRLARLRAGAAGVTARIEVIDAENLDVPDGLFSTERFVDQWRQHDGVCRACERTNSRRWVTG
jgi:hypothetical protein